MRGSDDKPLTDAEHWILLSLDDAEPLPDLVSRIVEVKPRSRIPWRRWEAREIRPQLGVDDASVALADLVAAALVEVRQVRRDELNNAEQVPVELGDGRTAMGSPHPFDLGRALSHDDVLTVVAEARNGTAPPRTISSTGSRPPRPAKRPIENPATSGNDRLPEGTVSAAPASADVP